MTIHHPKPSSGAGGGGAGALPYPDEPPASPSAFDDEFRTGSLDAIWTEVTSPDASRTKDYDFLEDWLYLSGPGHATLANLNLRQTLSGFASGNAFSVTAKVMLSDIQLGAVDTGIVIQDVTTVLGTHHILLRLLGSTGVLTFQVFIDGAQASSTTLPLGMGTWYIHLQRNTGNVIRVFLSHDGIGWRQVHTSTRAWDFTYLFTRMTGPTNTAHYTTHMIDWIRVGWLFLPAP